MRGRLAFSLLAPCLAMAQSPGTFTATGSMVTQRASHTATLLPNGKVLIAGGSQDLSAELYDPSTGTFTPTGNMIAARSGHMATLLANGKVLIAGGGPASAELYDPSTGMFTPTGSIAAATAGLATLLADGTVFVAGNDSAEIYDPATGTFTLTSPYADSTPALWLTATTLADGRVLLMGCVGQAAAELFDARTATFSVTSPPPTIWRGDCNPGADFTWTATLLMNGTVLLVESGTYDVWPVYRELAEVYDPATGTFTEVGSLQDPHEFSAAVRLADGTVLITGGESIGSTPGSELYLPATGAFASAGNMTKGRYLHTATLLPDGTVLIAGGISGEGYPHCCSLTASAEIYTPPVLFQAGSLAHVVSGGTWDFTLDAINLGTTTAQASLNFFDDNGNPLTLPLTFPQNPGTGSVSVSNLIRTLNPNAQLVIDSTQPAASMALSGWADLGADRDINGFGIFSNPTYSWSAVVPLETRNASSYILAFDNTGPLATGLAIANVAPQSAGVNVVIRDDSGAQIGIATLTLAALGHTSFLLNQQYPVTAGIRGTVEFDTPQGGQISVLGLRANGPALTTLPVLANVGTGGGSLAHATYNGGWTSTFYLVNTGTGSAQFTLSFFDNSGNPLSVPLSLPQTGATTTTSALTNTLAAGAMLLVQTEAQDGQPAAEWSTQLTTTGNIGGFEILRWTTFGQEASVPLETRTPNSFVLVFDDTDGLATGVALANVSNSPANIIVNVRDDTGALLQTGSINLVAQGHTSFLLPAAYASAANVRGMVEFLVPTGGKISVIGLRATADGTVTSIPVLAK